MLEIPHVVVRRQQDGSRRLLGGAVRRDRRATLRRSVARLGLHDARAIPISALRGDNVVERGGRDAVVRRTDAARAPRDDRASPSTGTSRTGGLPVQWVIRPMTGEHHDYRAYAGQIAAGVWRPGDEVVVLPSGLRVARRGRRGRRSRRRRRGRRRCRSRSGSRTTWTSGAVTCSPTPIALPAVAREVVAARLLDERAPARAARTAPRQAHDADGSCDRRRARLAGRSCTRSRTARRRSNSSSTTSAASGSGSREPLAVDPYVRNRATGSFILDRRGDERHRRRRDGRRGRRVTPAARGGGAGDTKNQQFFLHFVAKATLRVPGRTAKMIAGGGWTTPHPGWGSGRAAAAARGTTPPRPDWRPPHRGLARLARGEPAGCSARGGSVPRHERDRLASAAVQPGGHRLAGARRPRHRLRTGSSGSSRSSSSSGSPSGGGPACHASFTSRSCSRGSVRGRSRIRDRRVRRTSSAPSC